MRLPPGTTNGPDGSAWHSWRVKVYPHHMESFPTVYDYESPWNSPTNMRLLNRTPVLLQWKSGATTEAIEPTIDLFTCPSDVANCKKYSQVSYLVVQGDKTAFPFNKGIRIGTVVDGTSNTIGVVESCDSRINWTEPRDLEFATLKIGTDDTSPSFSSRHNGIVQVAFLDGSTHSIPSSVEEPVLKTLLTIAGDSPSLTRKWSLSHVETFLER